jgi:hypothetical protein
MMPPGIVFGLVEMSEEITSTGSIYAGGRKGAEKVR